MSINLLDMLKSQVGGQLASNASKFLGESESNVSSALGGIFPSLLGSLMDKGSTEQGAKGIMDMVKDTDTGMLDNIGDLFGGGASSVNGLLNSGSGMLSSLLGSKTGGLVDAIARMSGLKGGSSSSLLKMALPFVMSMIGRQVKSNGLGVSGLMDMLKGQKDHVKSALPAELSSSLGLAAFGDKVVGSGKKVVSGAADSVSSAASATADAGKRVVGGAADVAGNVADTAVSTGGGLLKWILPLLLVLGVGGWFMTKSGTSTGVDVLDNAAKTVASTTEKVAGGAADMAGKAADVAGDAAKGAAGAVGDAAGAVGDAVGGAFGAINEAGKKALDAVKFGAGSVGSQMMDFVKSGAKGTKTFSLKNANFATGSAALSAESVQEVDNLAAVLKAYTALKISVDGYTDSSGNADANKTLSQKRADSVKARLLQKGIEAARITAMGYGAANPIASNDTAEGKAKNRRIEVKIVK